MRKSLVVLPLIALSFSLGGCLNASQQNEMAQAEPKDDAYCRGLGAKPGEPSYVQCRLTLRQQLVSRHAEQRAAVSAFWDGVEGAGQAYGAGAAAARSNFPVNCTTTAGVGGALQTSCY